MTKESEEEIRIQATIMNVARLLYPLTHLIQRMISDFVIFPQLLFGDCTQGRGKAGNVSVLREWVDHSRLVEGGG